MTDPLSYLLRTDEEEAAFRAEFSEFIGAKRSEYAAWIRRLPMWKWVPYLDRVPPEQRKTFIGMICILQIEREVNISLSRDLKYIRREPKNDAELAELTKGFKNVKSNSNDESQQTQGPGGQDRQGLNSQAH